MEDEMSPSPPAPTDPRLPLSAMQVFKLKKSWKGIKRCLDETGVEMFIRLFKLKPSIKPVFSQFKDLSLDEMRVSEALEKHATSVMAMLDDCIQNIDNVDNTLEVMARAAALHNNLPGFSPHMYLEMDQPFLEAVKITLGDRYTDNMDGIYKIAIRYLLDTLVKTHQSVL